MLPIDSSGRCSLFRSLTGSKWGRGRSSPSQHKGCTEGLPSPPDPQSRVGRRINTHRYGLWRAPRGSRRGFSGAWNNSFEAISDVLLWFLIASVIADQTYHWSCLFWCLLTHKSDSLSSHSSSCKMFNLISRQIWTVHGNKLMIC